MNWLDLLLIVLLAASIASGSPEVSRAS